MMSHNKHALPDCPIDQLEWFANQSLPEAEQITIKAHLAHCATCQAQVTVWMELHQALQNAKRQTPEPRADLFLRIEQQLDLLPVSTPWSRFQMLPQAFLSHLTTWADHFVVQARLIRRELFWLPLCVLPLVALLVYWPGAWQQTPATIALVAVFLTALGMAFLYGQEVDPAHELVRVTPVSSRLVLGVRCCLVAGYSLLLNCGLVLPFLTLQGIVTPAWFFANWLAPLCCLSAIALLVSILANASAAVIVCLILWSLRLLNSMQEFFLGMSLEMPWQQYYESLWQQVPVLLSVSCIAIILTFVLFERREYVTQ